MWLFLRATFEFQDESLEMLLSYMELISASTRLPEIMIVFVCPVGEWGDPTSLRLDGLCRGTCHAVAHPSILQTVAEFRMKGNLYRGTKWISIEESKAAIGIEEAAFEIFVSCGEFPHRRNHDAETHIADRPMRDETCPMNTDDAPRVPSATESSYTRRPRCVVIRSKFSQGPDEICPGSRIYLAGDTLKDRIRWTEATSVFRATSLILMPCVRETSKSEFELRLRRPPAQLAADTAWTLRKMARIGPPDTPPLSHEGILSGR